MNKIVYFFLYFFPLYRAENEKSSDCDIHIWNTSILFHFIISHVNASRSFWLFENFVHRCVSISYKKQNKTKQNKNKNNNNNNNNKNNVVENVVVTCKIGSFCVVSTLMPENVHSQYTVQPTGFYWSAEVNI